MNFKKISIDEFDNLKRLFPVHGDWEKYKEQQLERIYKNELDIFVIENNDEFIGEISVNYISHELKEETIPNQRVYFEAFRIDKEFQGKRIRTKIIYSYDK